MRAWGWLIMILEANHRMIIYFCIFIHFEVRDGKLYVWYSARKIEAWPRPGSSVFTVTGLYNQIVSTYVLENQWLVLRCDA